jgi:DNA invertase Pin-like site-specific DNA recombinase
MRQVALYTRVSTDRQTTAGEAEKLLFVAVVAGTGIGREHGLVRALAAVMVGHERQVQSSMLVG